MIKNYITNGQEIGDYVQCIMCSKTMVINIGVEVCPSCNKEGYLSWVDTNKQELYLNEMDIINNNKKEH